MILYEPVKNLVLLFTFLNHYKSEIYTGIVGLENESDYFAKFCFLSTNSSIRFEFAFLEEILPLKMKTFWDSPRMWSAASQRPLVSCAKRQALLNSLSANQLFHLDPYMDGWCQRISLSDKIYNELIQSSYEETSIDWVSIMNKVITKISEYFKKSEESIEIKLPSNNITYNMTTAASTLMEMNKTESIKTTERKKSTFWFPEVLKMAWSNFKSNIDNDQQSMVISQWIYCQSANIPLIVKKPSWWFFTFDSCNEPLLNNEIKSLRKSQYTNIRNKIAYRITLRNGEYGHYFREHFSTQEFGKLEIDLVFFLFLAWLFFMANILLFHHYRSNILHPTVILWYTSVGLHFLAQFIQLIVDVNFAKSGYFNPFNTSLAQFFYATSISCFYASLLVLASGFTTVYRNISHNHKIIFLIISASYALINITCQISMVLTHYEVGVFSRYHSKPGYVYVGLQLFSFIAYICICLHTCVKWPDRRIYFIKFIAVSCIWFWTVPLWIIICLNHVHNWYIETLIHVWDELIHILGFIVMMIFLRPEKTNTIFPYYMNSICINESINPSEDWQVNLVTETINTSSKSSNTPVKGIEKKSVEQTDNKLTEVKKKIPPKRPNPPRLFNLTGKPGDIPAPRSGITSGLSELTKITTDTSKRPQTTPNLASTSNSPRLKPIDDKASSIH